MSHIVLTPLTVQALGPYTYVRRAVSRTIAGREFIVAIYGAYNAGGLIGSEHNGIVVLDQTRKAVVLDGHCPQASGYHGPSAAQLDEFGKVTTMDDTDFVTWCSTHPRSRGPVHLKNPKPPKPMVPLPKFTADQFTPTQWESAADKARFANHFAKFAARGFRRADFPKWFYKRLSRCFGHIAHYDLNGFYQHWFAGPEAHLQFIEHTLDSGGYGDPKYTYSDVERVLKQWLRDSGLPELVEQQRNAHHNN